MLSNNLTFGYSFLLLPSIFPSIRVFFSESALHVRWPKYWSFSFSVSPSKKNIELVLFRIGWLDLLAVQGETWTLLAVQGKTQESSPAPQFKGINSSAFFVVQLSHPYMTTGKSIALTVWTFVGKVTSLLLNMLCLSMFDSPLDSKGQQVNPKGNQPPEYSLERLMLKLKLQYFGHLMQRADSLEKTLVLGKIESKRRRRQQRMR